jgi:hypothetical protein
MTRAASTEREWPDLPGFAPMFSLNAIMARIISGGFGHEVAALSKYMGFI